jgi:hypothetical protein
MFSTGTASASIQSAMEAVLVPKDGGEPQFKLTHFRTL